MKELKEKLILIQSLLTVPKDRYNKFGEFYYRNGDDILKAAKPLCKDHGILLTLSDSVVEVGGRVYVKATATISDGTDDFSVDAFAREEEKRPKMADPMLTGSASSYARKYAMNGLFGLDDDSDPDNLNNSHAGQGSGQQGNTAPPRQRNPPPALTGDLKADAEKIIRSSGWAPAKQEAMLKNTGDPKFCQNVVDGKIK